MTMILMIMTDGDDDEDNSHEDYEDREWWGKIWDHISDNIYVCVHINPS